MAQVVNRLPPERFRHVIVFRNGRNAVGPRVRDDVKIVCLDDPIRNRRWALRLAKLLRTLKVTVVHNRELFTVSDTVAACRLAGVSRMAFSFHGFTDSVPVPNVATRWLWRRALRRYQARWAVSEAARDAVAETLRVRPETWSVLRNGVDCERFCPLGGSGNEDTSCAGTSTQAQARGSLGGEHCGAHARRRLGLPTTRLVLLAVGNMTTVKNHRLLLESIWAANLRPDRYTLVIVGHDRLDGELQRWASAKLPEHDIRFPGPVGNMPDWYRAADVFVLPSRSEGLCNALLEAMASGLAVVATDVPGNREVVRDDETGLLAAVEHPAGFGALLRRVVADGRLRRRLGHAAREHVTTEYDINRTVEAYARAYEGLCLRR